MLRFLTAGESHGQELTAIVEGIPAGITVKTEKINSFLQRRQQGYGRGGRMSIEKDRVNVVSGIRGGKTLGSPVTLIIENKDWANWQEVMDPGPDASLESRQLNRPRPGHADLPGGIKYHHRDLRNVLERASARETAARVAVGGLVMEFLEALGIRVISHVVSIGGIRMEAPFPPPEMEAWTIQSPVFCPDQEASLKMIEAIEKARKERNTLGGIFEIQIFNLPPGLGSFIHWDRRLDGQLSQALMSIPGIKGVEIGLGFQGAELPGSQVHDGIYYSDERGFHRVSNRAGGLEGGISNGETILLRAAMKPIPTLMNPLPSVDLETKTPVEASTERSDVCAVPAASVVGEAVVAPVLANAILEKFGGDSLDEILLAWNEYWKHVREF
ncbi:MAG TPA: chorismate synthase [Clostridia bacterium]|nr:chorismate synthase [Clostridia bacterium]